jgi:hypothetical protein
VPVPDGLAERLLERLAAGSDLHCPTVEPAHDRFGGRRRVSHILRLAGLLAAAAAIAVGVWLHGGGSTNPSEQQVLDEAIRCFMANAEPGAIGSKTISPTGYPWSQWIVQVAGTRCRALDGFLGRPGVAYDLPGLGGVHAVLYVVCPCHPLEGYPTSPAGRPFTTAGCCASAWQENGLLYALVVKGETASYEAYLNLAVEPVA